MLREVGECLSVHSRTLSLLWSDPERSQNKHEEVIRYCTEGGKNTKPITVALTFLSSVFQPWMMIRTTSRPCTDAQRPTRRSTHGLLLSQLRKVRFSACLPHKLARLIPKPLDWKTLLPLLPPRTPLLLQAHRAIRVLPARIEEAKKKETDEMMGKLKELGNTVLGETTIVLRALSRRKALSTVRSFREVRPVYRQLSIHSEWSRRVWHELRAMKEEVQVELPYFGCGK